MKLKIWENVATFGGAGNLPKAPGTFGTFAAWPLYVVLRRLSTGKYMLAIGGITLVGTAAAHKMEQVWGKDPSKVVIDEVAGLMITLISRPAGFVDILAGTLLFRAFDILKPPPVGTLDKNLPGGIGIMADDLAAGALAALSLKIVKKIGLLK